MKDEDRQELIYGRDRFNKHVTPLRNAYPEVKRIQDAMNKDINLVINPPPPKPPITKNRLAPEKRFAIGKKLVSPVLMPEYGITLKTTDEEAEAFADRYAKEGWGNFMRLFIAGNWERFYQNENTISMPYEWNSTTLFNLGVKNLDHFDQLFRRAEYLAERDIIPMFTLLDNCSIKRRPPDAFWGTHWMNGDNNVNGTSNEAYSQTHWYEYDGLPWYPNPEPERPGMRETGEHLLDLYGYVLREAKKRFGKFFLIEIGNEIDARAKYHRLIRNFIDSELCQGDLDGRVFTSMNSDHFYENRQMYDTCIPVVHGVHEYGDYKDWLHQVKGKHGASQDGALPRTTITETRGTALGILQTDSVMWEGNLRPLFVKEGGKWVNLINAGRYREIDWTLKSLPWDFLRAFGDAFEEYLG